MDQSAEVSEGRVENSLRRRSTTTTTPLDNRDSNGGELQRPVRHANFNSSSTNEQSHVSDDITPQDDVNSGGMVKVSGEDKETKLPKMPPKMLPHFGEHPVKKVRKWNKAAERKLEMDVEFLTQELKAKTSKLDKGIQSVEDELRDLDLEKSYTPRYSEMATGCTFSQKSNVTLPNIPCSRRHNSSRRQRSGHRCTYNPVKSKQKCHHFPCVRPKTYHTIGYRGDPGNTSWMTWEDIKQGWNLPNLVDNISTSVHDVKVSPRILTLRKEERLRRVIERRKLINDMQRPQSWETNYGQPTSFKQLKYPVRLYSLSN
ncbi:uncharacterized protein LOC124279299 [Haliotis rubra]|uniref:uncharacterized protein LOC124279299 n=1 Tax=Haliotis rubra TaxID=36100 RepID=UPI001EE59B9A|nr:uncharacterized protein LOC124279299 [Haliotis rubra]